MEASIEPSQDQTNSGVVADQVWKAQLSHGLPAYDGAHAPP